ncbi:uncharacterized protein GGS25DRAFT_533685 [Hypoxylon fragiforme]|uniref:uncharacterized protein n=1 Tax=Hypoxylon fragiforme TaxID=63214 RepID=UPI0020C73199|nr:uncharacterized protein GGS25DRAFT_533685 [Hypoxylon fragiforme]KAI2604790.1 hypothetical protein GGS25DRAFT_533685 [Hypoxylon fragiforme]
MPIRVIWPIFGVGDGPCNEWDGTGKRWFKIFEAGHIAAGVPGAIDPGVPKGLGTHGRSWHNYYINEVRVPGALKAGNYLIRHEVADLQDGFNHWAYCAQLAVPSDEYLAAFLPRHLRHRHPRHLPRRLHLAPPPPLVIIFYVVVLKHADITSSHQNHTMAGPPVTIAC